MYRACSTKAAVVLTKYEFFGAKHVTSQVMTSEFYQKTFRFAIDRGGTFTDVYAECPHGNVRILKLLSEDPAYKDAPREGIRRILQEVGQIEAHLHVLQQKY